MTKTQIIIKKRVAKETSTSVNKLFKQEIANLYESNNELKVSKDYSSIYKFENRSKTYYKKRQELMPPIPKSTNEIELGELFIKTSDHENFLIFDTCDEDRIMCFGSDLMKECLSNATVIHVDGTFKTSPALYYQSYSISAFYNQEMFPCLTSILKNKSEMIYSKLLENILKHVPINPELILMDFEMAVINSFQKAFPNAIIKGIIYSKTLLLNVNL